MLARKTFRKWLNKRAVGNVVSATILTGVAITLGLATLAWSQSMASNYVQEYGETIYADIAKLKERLAVEYIFYDNPSGNVTVYLLNCGTIDDVEIQSVCIRNSTWNHVFSDLDLKFLNGTSIPDQDLDIGEEGYVVLSPVPALTSVYYHVGIVTVRGMKFDSGFVA